MDSTVTPSTVTFDLLNNAIEINKNNVKTFKEMIVGQLKFIIEHLENCDPTNASDALDLTLPQLKTVVSKISDNRGMLTTDVESILAPLKAIQLRKAPDSATPLAIGPTRNSLSNPSMSLPAPPGQAVPPTAPLASSPAVPSLPQQPPAKSIGSITSPGEVESTGINKDNTVPGRIIKKGGRRTRRKGKSKCIV